MEIDLSGKVALVTGASRGIGRGIVEGLSEARANVVINYHTSKEEAQNLASRLEKENDGKAMPIQADVTEESEVQEMMDKVKEEFGKVDILVNNAGGLIERSSIEEMPEELWDKILNLNAKSVFLCSKAVIPLMKPLDEGRIINITSVAGENGGGVGAGHYASAKGAARLLTTNMSKEFAKYDITVNAVEPGIVDTDFWRKIDVSSEELKESFGEKIPLERVSLPKDLARAVVFLASEGGEYVTDEHMRVAGGYI